MTEPAPALDLETIERRCERLSDWAFTMHARRDISALIARVRELEAQVKDLEEQNRVGLDLTGSFFMALKPLNLPAINVQNPGAHITDLIRDRAYHERKWREYERDYILPCLKWAKEVGFDLQQAVFDNPGKNCVQLLVEHLRSQIESKREKGDPA